MNEIIPILKMEQFLHRLRQEAERALRYSSQFTVLSVVSLNADPIDSEALRNLLTDKVRLVDTVGFGAKDEIVFIFPEIDETAGVPGSRIVSGLGEVGVSSKGGMAVFPHDGTDAEVLLTRAREAAALALAGTIEAAAPEPKVLEIDGHPVIAADAKTKRLFALVKNLAKSTLPVLITGDTGVGKEVVARALHSWSPRKNKEIVSINCAAMPETLLESELFGHEKGAFSGAIAEKKGLFETAEKGTLFLDEISEASLRVQAGLLRVLETKRVRRVGSVTEKEVDVRIVSATNRDLEKDIKSGRFRRDLYFRLCAATVNVPRLRRRLDDLPELSLVFLKSACRDLGVPLKKLNPYTLTKMAEYSWPGNVRELKHLMEFMAATVTDTQITPEYLPHKIQNSTGTIVVDKAMLRPEPETQKANEEGAGQAGPLGNLSEEIQELERRRIKEALMAAGGVRSEAAKLIGMPLRTMVSKIKKYGLSSIKSQKSRSKKGS